MRHVLSELCQQYPPKAGPKTSKGWGGNTSLFKSHGLIYWAHRSLGCADQKEKQAVTEVKNMGVITTATQWCRKLGRTYQKTNFSFLSETDNKLLLSYLQGAGDLTTHPARPSQHCPRHRPSLAIKGTSCDLVSPTHSNF